MAAGLVLAGVALLWIWQSKASKTPTETPKIVDVIVSTGNGRRTLQIRDPQAIVILQSLITGGRAADGQPPGYSEFQIFVYPTGKSSYSYLPSPVWRIANDRFAWRHKGRTTELNGSLTDFIEWMKIRRINQLLRSPDPAERRFGEQLRDSARQEHVESLIRIANSENGWFAQAGIREISDIISIEAVYRNHYVLGEMRWPLRRAVADPDRRICDELLSLVKRCPRSDHGDDPFGVGYAALQCLQQIGDRKTGDSLVKLIAQHQGGRLGDPVLTTIEQSYGIPSTYERHGICGNSSSEEIASFARNEAKRQAAAIDELLAWQQDHVNDSDEDFYDAVVLRWSEMLIHFAKTPNRTFDSDRTPAPQLAHLLGLGKPVVPALERRKKTATGWHEIAMLDFCVAFLTGECDRDLVTELLAGDLSQQRVACFIIAASADPTWNDRIAALLRTPIPDGNVNEAVVLRDAAAQALYRTSGVKALTELRAALKEGFDSWMLLQILDRFDISVDQY